MFSGLLGLGRRVEGLRMFRVQGFGFRAQGKGIFFGFRAEGSRMRFVKGASAHGFFG